MLQRGQLELAEDLIRQSIAFLEQYESPDLYLSGYAWRALAHVHVAQQRKGRADITLQYEFNHEAN